MKFESFLALKYIRSKDKNRFISFSSLMSILGIIVGVSALIIVMGVMSGFDHELESKIMGVTPNVIIHNFSGSFNANQNFIKKLMTYKGVKSVYTILVTQGIVTANGSSTGAILNGLNLKQHLQLNKYIKGKRDGAILGSQLMLNLGLHVGDVVRITLPFGKTTPFGFAPLSFKTKITGVFQSGMYDYDSSLIYMPLKKMWLRTDMSGYVNTIAINLKNPYNANKFIEKIALRLPAGFYASSWIDMNKAFFSALKLEKFAMFVILMLVILVAAFNITSSLTMLVMDKMRDMAMLISFGATKKNIRNIFLKQSLMLGLVGIVGGDFLGLLLSYLLKKYHFIKLPSSVYYITNIPVNINILHVILISIGVLALVSLASIYPSYKATKINIVEILRQ